jgi:hypothetical protein
MSAAGTTGLPAAGIAVRLQRLSQRRDFRVPVRRVPQARFLKEVAEL